MTANLRLSLCMIVRNESAHLARCLRSVRGVADDVVVVDTGSSDDTAAIARGEGARVFQFPWVDDFAKARNHSLEQALAPWILVLDGDEQLVERDRRTLRRLVEGKPERAYQLVVKNSSDGGRTGMLAHVLRLFPNRPTIRYDWPIHEQVGTSLMRERIPVEETKIEILHDGYADAGRNVAKQRRNLAILTRQVEEGGAVGLTYFLKAGAHLDLGEYADAFEAYRQCIQRSVTGDPFAAGANVRLPVCLEKMGRYAEARELLRAPTHPEGWLALGKALLALGRFSEALEAFRSLLAMEEALFMPPCDLTTIKLEGIMAAAMILKSTGREPAALRLMRDAVARRQGGLPFDRTWVQSLGW